MCFSEKLMWPETGSVNVELQVQLSAHLEAGVLLWGSCSEELVDQVERILREARRLVGQLNPFHAIPDVAISRSP